MKQATWTSALSILLFVGSCHGCDPDNPGGIDVGLGAPNPLLHRVQVEGLGGVVVPIDRPAAIRIDFILPVDLEALGDESFELTATPPEEAGPDVEAEVIDLDSVEPLRVKDGRARGVRLRPNVAQLAAHGGFRLLVKIDASRWTVAGADDPAVFKKVTGYPFEIASDDADNDPPFLVDIRGMTHGSWDAALGLRWGDEPTVPAHVGLIFEFSEPMASFAPVVIPEDVPGFHFFRERDEQGRRDLESFVLSSARGLVPGQRYCASFPAPLVTRAGPFPWATQDRTGEPVVPTSFDARRRRQSRDRAESPEVCFLAGAARIESPQTSTDALPAADSERFAIELVRRCDARRCAPDLEHAFQARLANDDPDRPLGGGWMDLARIAESSAVIDRFDEGRLRQGEIVIDAAEVELHSAEIVDGLKDLCGDDANDCRVELREDLCERDHHFHHRHCDLGDVVALRLDLVAPPAIDPEGIHVADGDPEDGGIDRICVDLVGPEEGESLVVEFVFATGSQEVVLRAEDATEVALGDQGVGDASLRRCWTGIAIPPAPGAATLGGVVLAGAGGSGEVPTGLFVSREDAAGNRGPKAGGTVGQPLPLVCSVPPRKFLTYDGRRSALVTNLADEPTIITPWDGSILPAGTGSRSLFAHRWDATADQWVREVVACSSELSPSPDAPTSAGDCTPLSSRLWGPQVDADVNVRGEPVACATHATPSVGEGPGWELDMPATVLIAVRAGSQWIRTRVASASPGSPARNLGCAVIARRAYFDPSAVGDYVVAFAEERAGELRLALRYVNDVEDVAGNRSLVVLDVPEATALSNRSELVLPGKLSVDLASDELGRLFLGVLGTSPVDQDADVMIVREDQGRFRDVDASFVPIASDSSIDDVIGGLRLTARGDGEAAIVWTERTTFLSGDVSLRWAQLGPGSTTPLARRVLRPTGNVPVFDSHGGAQLLSPNLKNHGSLDGHGVASIDGLVDGIPVDIHFGAGLPAPMFAFAAEEIWGGALGTKEYYAVLLATPHPDGEHHTLEVVDARIEGSANVDLDVGPAGDARIVYHNGLAPDDAPRQAGTPPDIPALGTLSFFRAEDGDALFATTGPRCFAERLQTQGDTDMRSPLAGLDDDAIALVPRPALDPDPCQRTVDPGLAQAVIRQAFEAVTGGALPLDQTAPLFARLPGETSSAYAARTNEYRKAAFLALRDALGDVSFLDTAFPREDDVDWNAAAIEGAATTPTIGQPTLDELFDPTLPSELDPRDEGRLLDPIFLTLDELTEDLCGNETIGPPSCPSGPASILRTACDSPGAFRRNPNGYYPGLFYDASDPPEVPRITDVYSADALDEFADSFEGTIFDDDTMPPRAFLGFEEPPGLLTAALRGWEVDDIGAFRTVDHVCEPIRSADCEGIFAAPFPGGPTERTAPATSILEVDDTMADRSTSCPELRPGAQPTAKRQGNLLDRVSTGPELQRIGASSSACCSGYGPVECSTSADCSELFDFSRTTGCTGRPPPTYCFEGDPPELAFPASVEFAPRCVGGFCQRVNDDAIRDCGSVPDDSEPICSRACLLRGNCPAGLYEYACVPDSCFETDPMYCEASEPVLDSADGRALLTTLCGDLSGLCVGADPGAPALLEKLLLGVPLSDDELAFIRTFLTDPDFEVPRGFDGETMLAMVRGATCSPGSECVNATSKERHRPPPALRQLLGHYAMRLITIGLALDNDDTLEPLLELARDGLDFIDDEDFRGANVTHERVESVAVAFHDLQDGDLRLQGSLDLVIRFEDPGVTVSRERVAGGSGRQHITVDAFEATIRLQPYFFPSEPPGGTCDGCGRRRPDESIHWRVATAGMFQPGTDSLPDADADCGAFECSLKNDCDCTEAVDEALATDISSADDAVAALNALFAQRARTLEGTLDAPSYFLIAHPLLGGVLAGRPEAVRAMGDFPECVADQDGDGTLDVAATDENVLCATPTWLPDRSTIADTIESVVIDQGRATIRARDNP